MKFPKDYLDDLLVRMTYHSSAIENNTITLSETISILLHHTIPNKVSVREFYEVENHRMAFNFIVENTDRELSISLIHDVHSLLMDRIHHERGRFKTHENAIVGATFQTASAKETPLLIHQWVQNLTYQIEQAQTTSEIVKAVCYAHIQFERIHPYADGNGRTGRLIMMFLLLKNNILPFVIPKESKYEYIRFLEDQDVEGFSAFASSILEQESLRYEAFLNSKSE
ncbi:Fic family protein [Paenibacillus albicereus]|uniref:Fic family protein n=1 Tax=Paenibacillus albicereus TaxID=2726185 RepID=A0A6H2GTR3_9BACL|nr:Fic family protein [Paenibacillus albicereus]QJC50782.1 Fic family protein [Paenibacillus albicereus]